MDLWSIRTIADGAYKFFLEKPLKKRYFYVNKMDF